MVPSQCKNATISLSPLLQDKFTSTLLELCTFNLSCHNQNVCNFESLDAVEHLCNDFIFPLQLSVTEHLSRLSHRHKNARSLNHLSSSGSSVLLFWSCLIIKRIAAKLIHDINTTHLWSKLFHHIHFYLPKWCYKFMLVKDTCMNKNPVLTVPIKWVILKFLHTLLLWKNTQKTKEMSLSRIAFFFFLILQQHCYFCQS
jgi:hypothetical protein